EGTSRSAPRIAPMMWYLEGFVDDERRIWRTLVHRFPFRIGRRSDADMVLQARQVSNHHAELYLAEGKPWIRDLDSTNGTFLNGRRLRRPRPVQDGDRLGFARHELRFLAATEPLYYQVTESLGLASALDAEQIRTRGAELRELIAHGRLRVRYQPLICLEDWRAAAYEALGRGWVNGTEASPAYLFDLAESPAAEARLSRELRSRALQEARAFGGRPRIFLNTHPSELRQGADALLRSMEVLRERYPRWPIALEVHEAAVIETSALTALGHGLRQLGVDLAFDDFGTGQARLLELAEVEPKFLKFDRDWIHGLGRAFQARREMVAHLVRMVEGLGIATVAEGVETEAEARACRDLGFDLAQGFHFARPATVDELVADGRLNVPASCT
ncbi:MAG: EAL domain-containing protein, partial [Holophagales bacterium]|nr:EAL domain-containing protein [Holophagales bacterium]